MGQGFNPYLPSWEYIPDGEPHIFGDRVYLYGSHDRYDGWVFCQEDYVCWSAPVHDLTDWSYEGVIYRRQDDPDNRNGHMCLFAPDVAQGPDGRYYLYYVLDKLDIVSVAVSDSPAGPFRFAGHVHYPDGTCLGARAGDEPQFDPGILRENDAVYMVTGFCGAGDKKRHGAMLTVLQADMMTVSQPPRCIAPGCEYAADTDYREHPFFEGPSLRKIGNRYFLIYSSSAMHELCYAVSEKPTGPYRYKGVLISNCDLHIADYKPGNLPTAYGGNNHGSILTVGDASYIFYHRHTNGQWYSRQACAERLVPDGHGGFLQAGISSCGLNGGPLRGQGRYPAYIACYLFAREPVCMSGAARQPRVVQAGPDSREDGYITGIRDGVTLGFHSFAFRNTCGVSVRVRGYGSGFFEVKTDIDGPALARIPIRYANNWQDFSAPVRFPDGCARLFFTYHAPTPPDPEHAVLQLHSIFLGT